MPPLILNHTCPTCQTVFRSAHREQVYCSRKCRKSWKVRPTRRYPDAELRTDADSSISTSARPLDDNPVITPKETETDMTTNPNPNYDSAAAHAALARLEAAETDAEYEAAEIALHAAWGMTDRQVLHLPDGGKVISYCHPGDDIGHLFAEGWAETIAISQAG